MEKNFKVTKENTTEISKKMHKIITKKKQNMEMKTLSRSNSVIKTKTKMPRKKRRRNTLKTKLIINTPRKR